jgi:RNA polymerase sigma factor (sigma-70 family)
MTIAVQLDVDAMADAHADGTLLAEVAAGGSGECFEQLVGRHAHMVLGVCRRQLGNGHDAEDAAQAVFLVLWKKAGSLRGRASVAGWLHHVARNVCRNAKRAKSVRQAREREAAKMNQKIETPAESWDEIKEVLDDELDRLPEKYRLPIILSDMEGQSQEEIATLLETNRATIATRIRRGREMLRSRLARRGVTIGISALAASLTTNACTAALPVTFTSTTTQAAMLYAGGKLAAGGLLSAKTAALAEGTLKMLTIAKMKMAAAVIVTATVVTGGSVAVVQQVAQGEPVKQPVKVVGRKEMPLKVIWSANPLARQTHALNKPMIVLGQRPNIGDDTLDKILAGQFKLAPPTADVETVALIVGSELRGRWAWRPTQVHLNGNKITLFCERWHDNALHGKGHILTPLYLVSLGKLAAGDYEFNFRISHLRLDASVDAVSKHYRTGTGLSGKLKVSIAMNANESGGKEAPSLAKDQMKRWEAFGISERQRVDDPWSASPAIPVVNYLEIPRAIDGLPALGPRAGTFDLKARWPKPPTKWADIPGFRQPKLGEPVYVAVLGPELNASERMTLTNVEWSGRKVRLRVGLWRDGVTRKQNKRRSPLLVIPLHEGLGHTLREPGQYEVEVEWSLLYSPDPKDGLYTHYTAKTVADAAVRADVQKSFLALTATASRTTFTLAAADKQADARKAKSAIVTMTSGHSFLRMKMKLDLVVYADGSFRYGNRTGNLMPEDIERLREQIGQADNRSLANDAGVHRFFWNDQQGRRFEKFFGDPTAEPQKKLLADIAALAEKHGQVQQPKVAWGPPKDGLRIGLSAAQSEVDEWFELDVWYENVGNEPRKVYIKKDCNWSHLFFTSEYNGKRFYIPYVVSRSALSVGKQKELKPGERFRETLTLLTGIPNASGFDGVPEFKPGETLDMQIGLFDKEPSRTKGDEQWRAPQTRRSGSVTLTRAVVEGDATADRKQKLLDRIDKFRLYVHRDGAPHQHVDRLWLQTAPLGRSLQPKPKFHSVQISREQAEKIIEELARSGFLRDATPFTYLSTRDDYLLRVGFYPYEWHTRIGLGDTMRQRLKSIRGVLDGDAAEAMDRLFADPTNQVALTKTDQKQPILPDKTERVTKFLAMLRTTPAGSALDEYERAAEVNKMSDAELHALVPTLIKLLSDNSRLIDRRGVEDGGVYYIWHRAQRALATAVGRSMEKVFPVWGGFGGFPPDWRERDAKASKEVTAAWSAWWKDHQGTPREQWLDETRKVVLAKLNRLFKSDVLPQSHTAEESLILMEFRDDNRQVNELIALLAREVPRLKTDQSKWNQLNKIDRYRYLYANRMVKTVGKLGDQSHVPSLVEIARNVNRPEFPGVPTFASALDALVGKQTDALKTVTIEYDAGGQTKTSPSYVIKENAFDVWLKSAATKPK